MAYRNYSKNTKALKKSGNLILIVLSRFCIAIVWIIEKIIVPTLKGLWWVVRKYPKLTCFFLFLITIIFFREAMAASIGKVIGVFLIIGIISALSKTSATEIGFWGWFVGGGGQK